MKGQNEVDRFSKLSRFIRNCREITSLQARLESFEVAVYQSYFWPKAIFIVARGIAPGKRRYTTIVLANGHIQSKNITDEYGRWPKIIIHFVTRGVAPGYVAKGRWP